MAKAAKKEKKASKAKDNGILRVEDIRALSADQQNEAVVAAKKEQFNARFQKLAGEPVKPSRLRALRKNIARIKTVQNESKQAGGNNA